MSCVTTGPDVSSLALDPIILNECLLDSTQLDSEVDSIDSVKGCDILTPETARQILELNRNISL